MNVGKALFGIQNLQDIEEPIRRNPIYVISVESGLVWAQLWFYIKKFILEKNPILVDGVLKISVEAQTLLNIKEFTLVKNV